MNFKLLSMNIDNIMNPEEKQFIDDIYSIVAYVKEYAYKSVNVAQVVTNWLIGKRIVEQEKRGKGRANYGMHVVKLVSESLTNEFGVGYSITNVKSFVKFFQVFNNLAIGQTVSAQLQISTKLVGQMPSAQFMIPLLPNVCWSHYERLMRIEDETERLWYLQETARGQWSVKTLHRNISSQYYYRLLRSPHKEKVKAEMCQLTAPLQNKLEFIKNPVIAEFLGFKQDADFTESELEQSIITHLQNFIMELGKGFAFVARQKHIRTDMGDFYIDLVFYNYILKCFFLIDLKTSQITHQDVGQMDMYVRMYDKLQCTNGDNPTIGLLLCSSTSGDMARYSVLNGNEQIFQAKYLTFLPTKEELIREIERQKVIFEMQKGEQMPSAQNEMDYLFGTKK